MSSKFQKLYIYSKNLIFSEGLFSNNWWMKEYVKCAELEARMNQIRFM